MNYITTKNIKLQLPDCWDGEGEVKGSSPRSDSRSKDVGFVDWYDGDLVFGDSGLANELVSWAPEARCPRPTPVGRWIDEECSTWTGLDT